MSEFTKFTVDSAAQPMLERAKEQEPHCSFGNSGICCLAGGAAAHSDHGRHIAETLLHVAEGKLKDYMDAMVVDVQCIMPSLRSVAECFHTKIITTMPIMKIPGAYHYAFDDKNAMKSARDIVRLAIKAYTERDEKKVNIPNVRSTVVAGFSVEAILTLFKNINPDNPISVITDAIASGEIKGVALFAGCNNLKGVHDQNHLEVAKGLAKNNVFMVATGCAAQAFAKEGLLSDDGVEKYAGEGLKKFIGRLNEKANLTAKLPLIFHMGSCVDKSRSNDFATMIANEMELDISEIPYVASAPEAMSEKSVAIGSYHVAMGTPTHVGVIPPVTGSTLVHDVVTKIAEDVFGGYFILETDPHKAVDKLVAVLDERNWKLAMQAKARAERTRNEEA